MPSDPDPCGRHDPCGRQDPVLASTEVFNFNTVVETLEFLFYLFIYYLTANFIFLPSTTYHKFKSKVDLKLNCDLMC